MIPQAYITQWRQFAPWPDDMQVEQDLILSRIIVEIFSDPLLSKELAFRGGTALHKLFFTPPARYSEDIDLVRTGAGAIGSIADKVRDRLAWLGDAKTERTEQSFKFNYRFNPETSPASKQRVKIEINVRENFKVFDYLAKDYSIRSGWFTGNTKVNTFQFEELIATKLRALYQRKKGRDLFDLWLALKQEDLNVKKIIHAFQYYMQQENNSITRGMFEKNLARKLQEPSFFADIGQLLSSDLRKTQSLPLGDETGYFLLIEDGTQLLTERWSLNDAAEEVKNKILIYLSE